MSSPIEKSSSSQLYSIQIETDDESPKTSCHNRKYSIIGNTIIIPGREESKCLKERLPLKSKSFELFQENRKSIQKVESYEFDFAPLKRKEEIEFDYHSVDTNSDNEFGSPRIDRLKTHSSKKKEPDLNELDITKLSLENESSLIKLVSKNDVEVNTYNVINNDFLKDTQSLQISNVSSKKEIKIENIEKLKSLLTLKNETKCSTTLQLVNSLIKLFNLYKEGAGCSHLEIPPEKISKSKAPIPNIKPKKIQDLEKHYGVIFDQILHWYLFKTGRADCDISKDIEALKQYKQKCIPILSSLSNDKLIELYFFVQRRVDSQLQEKKKSETKTQESIFSLIQQLQVYLKKVISDKQLFQIGQFQEKLPKYDKILDSSVAIAPLSEYLSSENRSPSEGSVLKLILQYETYKKTNSLSQSGGRIFSLIVTTLIVDSINMYGETAQKFWEQIDNLSGLSGLHKLSILTLKKLEELRIQRDRGENLEYSRLKELSLPEQLTVLSKYSGLEDLVKLSQLSKLKNYPEDIFDAVKESILKGAKENYVDKLDSDFTVIPFPKSLELYKTLWELGLLGKYITS